MQLFGTKLWEHYSKLSTREFTEKFYRGLKVSQEHQNLYVKNLSVLVNDFIFSVWFFLSTNYMLKRKIYAGS